MSLPKVLQKIINNVGYGQALTGNDNDIVHKTGDETINGGKTFTGSITINTDTEIHKENDTGSLRLCSGLNANYIHGSKIALYGSSHTSNPGGFDIYTGDANGYNILSGKPDNSLTWKGKDITGDVHTTGNETISGEKTFNNRIYVANGINADIRKPTSDTYLRLCGGDDAYYTAGAKLVLAGSSFVGTDTVPTGGFWLMTGHSTGFNILSGFTDGRLTWIGKDITGDVHKTGDETIGGKKTFTSDIVLSGDSNICKPDNTGIIRLCGGISASYATGAKFYAYGASNSSNAGQFAAATGGTSKIFLGKPDGTLTWNGQPVQTSSDERMKTSISDVNSDILDAWDDVQWGEFKFLDAVEEKGENARYHVGLIAQSVDRTFKNRGRDILKYGILCHEESEETEDSPAQDLWMVRYTEALCMEAAYNRRRVSRLEEKIKLLEQKINLAS